MRVTSHESRVTSGATIRSFTDLNAWRESHALVVSLYQVTKAFPKEEQFGLTNQMRRAAVSITSNIAEGFGRRTQNDRVHFYDMARASLAELQSQLLVARDVDYLPVDSFQKLAIQAVECHKVLTGLINATRNRDS
jgi:four helix bundle protein